MIENYQANRFCEPLRDCFFSESSIFILPSCPFNRNVIHNLKRLQSINFCSFVFLDWLWKQGDKEICTWFASVKMVQKVLLRTLVHLIAWEFFLCVCFTIIERWLKTLAKLIYTYKLQKICTRKYSSFQIILFDADL